MDDSLLAELSKGDLRSSPKRHPEDESSSGRSRSASNASISSAESRGRIRSSRLSTASESSFTQPSTMPSIKLPNKHAGNYNTGVKGVIADARSFETHKRRQRQAQQHSRSASVASEIFASSSVTAPLTHNENDNSSDEDIMMEWRKNRLAELKASAANNRRRSPTKRHYGRVERVDANGYLDAVEKVGSETIVVVTIYDDSSSESRFVEDCLQTLARKFVTTRFVKLHHDIAEMDRAVVPAILAYKGGDLFCNMPRIVDEIPPGRALSVDSLEFVLRQNYVLKDD